MNYFSANLALRQLCLLLAMVSLSTSAVADTGNPVEPVLAPDWTLKDLEGHPVSLSQYKGKVVVLNFWGTFCTPCLKEIPAFVALQQRYANKGLVVIGAAMDQNQDAEVKTFASKFFVNYPIVITSSSVSHEYGVIGAPATFIIDKTGFIIFRHIGALTRNDLERQLLPLL